MLLKGDFRNLMEAAGNDGAQFAAGMLHRLGLTDASGRRHTTPVGHGTLVNPKNTNGSDGKRLLAESVSFEAMGRGILGDDTFELLYSPDSRRLVGLRSVLEAGEVHATAFANINAFTGVVAGLLEVKVLEGWENPEFIGDKLMPDEPSKMFEGRKVIGTGRVGDQAEERLPLMATKRVQFGERWIRQPRTVENAMACEVSQEAVFLDLTGEVLQEANNLGEWLRYRKELRQIDCFLGVTNTYEYKGTAYNTYIAAGYFDNYIAANANPLTHYSNVNTALIKFRDMTDPETSTRVLIRPNTILVNRENYMEAQAVLNAHNVQYRDDSTAAHRIREFANPVGGQFTLLESPLVYERMTAANGLNVAASVAGTTWFMFENGKAFKYVTNWPLRVQQAAPGQLEMIDRGVILYCKADERGIPMVYEPRRIVQMRGV